MSLARKKSVKKLAAVPREWINQLLDFTTVCASTPLESKDNIMGAISDAIQEMCRAERVLVWKIQFGFLVQEETGTVVTVAEEDQPVVRCFLSGEIVREGVSSYFPIIAMAEVLGLIQVENAADTTQKKVHDDRVIFEEAITAVSALFLQNMKTYENLRVQHNKASAMLQMANHLSRDVLNQDALVNAIMGTARQLTEADRCSVFLVDEEQKLLRAYFENDKRFVEMSIDSGIAGHVAKTAKSVNIEDAYTDSRFNPGVDKATGYKTKTILCMPVEYEGHVVAVAQLINKLPVTICGTEYPRCFCSKDEDMFKTFSTFIGVSLRNCKANAIIERQKLKDEALLSVARTMTDTDIRDLDTVVSHVVRCAQTLLHADHCSLFLVDREHDCLVSKASYNTMGSTIQVPSGKGIVGVVARTGVPDMVADAYLDSRFNQEVDKKLNYKTKSIITLPIFCHGEVIAAAQLLNKKDNVSGAVIAFSADDSSAFNDFAVYAGVALSNAQLLEFAVKAGQDAVKLSEAAQGMIRSRRSSVVEELVRIDDAELKVVMAIEIPSDLLLTLQTNNFDLFRARRKYGVSAPDFALRAVFDLVKSTGLLQQFHCQDSTIVRFLMACRQRYRAVPYHNFYHAVDVAQTIYTFLYQGHVSEMLLPVECLTLFVIAMVHDLDHMGLNNSFHLKTDTPLGILSSVSGNTSVLEVHHCNLAVEILGVKEQNVFGGLGEKEQSTAIRHLIECVLATDMARHGDLLKTFSKAFIEKNPETCAPVPFDKSNDVHRLIVMKMITKAADISNVTKPFEISRLWGMSVTEEFLRQGDAEKQKGVEVQPMFDRAKNTELAKGQLGFINFVAEGFFSTIVKGLFQGMQFCLDNISKNKEKWTEELEMSRLSKLSES